ncbi:putative hexose transporter protein [Neofusicoccum parvum UCRNP2]|uniref:Putative hexose transporter protein n=1 Tax=Botryosphaeria parva (strain UCR-NP2) TaxID=1287680 RepID=R1EF51_BOTPV|nr:putative hexose transporter protein [Neofusicoccum parvum UCRNP2]
MSNTQYSTGAIVAAWITFGSFRMNSTWSWRIPSVFQALPSIFQAVGILFLPESPRWLVSKGRNEKALEVLAHYHANGDREDPVVQYEYNEICSTIEMEIAAKQTKWSELWRTPGNRWRSFIMIWCGICKQWSGNGLVSYYLHSMLNSAGIKTELQQTLITATSQMFSLALFVEKGQSWSGSESASYASVAFIYLYSGVHNLGWTGAMMVYVVEVLPYTLRAKGIALFWLLTGAAGAFNTYVNPLGLEAFDWKFYWFYVAWIAVEFVVVYIFFIETKGPSLEAVAMLFDGKDATVGEVNKVVEAVKETKGGVEHVDVVEESR